MGAAPAEIARWTDAADSSTAEHDLWADLLPAVELFLASASQWRYAAHVPVGLDYGAVRWIAETNAIAVTPQILADLRVLESAAAGALAKR